MRTKQEILDELAALMKKEALAELMAKLGGDTQPTAPRSKSFVVARQQLKAATRAPAVPTKRFQQPKRDPAEMARLEAGALKFIQENPNCASPAIAQSLGVERVAIVQPLKKLRVAGKITVKGDRKQAVYRAKA